MTSITNTLDVDTVACEVRALADEFAQHRSERQRRRELDRADFERLQAAGFQLTGVPVENGGLWQDAVHSTRPIAEMLRALAHGDSSVALVASMHPSVLFSTGWLARPHAKAAGGVCVGFGTDPRGRDSHPSVPAPHCGRAQDQLARLADQCQ